MGQQRRDGSIQSSNLPAHKTLAKTRIDRDFGIYRCMIVRTNFVGQESNLTFENKQVTYEAVILGGPKEGQIIQNVKSSGDYGGQFNYSEKIWRPIDTKELNEKKISEHKGDIVFVGFLQGNTRAPVIIGGGVQPNDIDSTGSTSDTGFRMRKEYNGIFEEINKNGEYELRRKGGKLSSENGVFTPASDSFEARIQFKANQMIWEDPNSSILFEKAEQRWTHKVGSGGYEEVIDGKAKKVTQTLGSVTVTIDGSSNKMTIVAGSATLEIDGNSGKISLQSGFIDLGKSVSDFSVLFTELATAFNTHTHMVPQAPSGVLPSMPPIAPLLQTVSSTTVKLQP